MRLWSIETSLMPHGVKKTSLGIHRQDMEHKATEAVIRNPELASSAMYHYQLADNILISTLTHHHHEHIQHRKQMSTHQARETRIYITPKTHDVKANLQISARRRQQREAYAKVYFGSRSSRERYGVKRVAWPHVAVGFRCGLVMVGCL